MAKKVIMQMGEAKLTVRDAKKPESYKVIGKVPCDRGKAVLPEETGKAWRPSRKAR